MEIVEEPKTCGTQHEDEEKIDLSISKISSGKHPLKTNFRSRILILLASLCIAASAIYSISIYFIYRASNQNNLCKTYSCIRAADRIKQSMDFQIDPCEDFYQFTCGNWIENDGDTENSAISLQQKKLLYTIRRMLQSHKRAGEPNAIEQARILHQSCMNTTQIDSVGLQPVIDYLRMVHLPEVPSLLTIADKNTSFEFDWIRTIAKIKRTTGINILFGFYVIPSNRTRIRVNFGEPTNQTYFFTLDENTYEKRSNLSATKNVGHFDDYAENTADNINVDKEAVDYISDVIQEFVSVAKPNIPLKAISPIIRCLATEIIKMQTYFKELLVEAENFDKSDLNVEDYENLSIKEFQNLTTRLIASESPPIWEKYLDILFEDMDPTIELVSYPIDVYYIERALSYISNLPNEMLELYIWWSVVDRFVPYTTTYLREWFKFPTTRSIQCTSIVNRWMGMAVAYALADRNFVQTTKPNIRSMIEYIRRAFHNLVDEVNWMDNQSKSSTHEKLDAMINYVGLPEMLLKTDELDKYYGPIKLNQSAYLKNLFDVVQWHMTRDLTKLHLNNDMINWFLTPVVINAFYGGSSNAMAVSLPYMQYPYYDLGLESLNYGAVGTSIGHETTHGFDSNGRKLDKGGNRLQWWTSQTIAEFENRTECFIEQYGNYYIKELDEYVDGEFTLSENIADNGGVRAAFNAYQLYVKENGREQLLPGFEQYSAEQLFFISYGNKRCEGPEDESNQRRRTDQHAPSRDRVNGVIENSDEFKRAFKCHFDYDKNQCRIW